MPLDAALVGALYVEYLVKSASTAKGTCGWSFHQTYPRPYRGGPPGSTRWIVSKKNSSVTATFPSP